MLWFVMLNIISDPGLNLGFTWVFFIRYARYFGTVYLMFILGIVKVAEWPFFEK